MYLSVEETFQFLDKIPPGNLIEFGVLGGSTLNRLIKGAEQLNSPFTDIYGFDSFVGLPEEVPFVWKNPHWPKGAFNACEDFGLNSIEEAIEYVKSKVDRKGITLIPGFFDISLTDDIGKQLSDSASFIHCDVDIYLSSYQCMDWVWKHKILKPYGLVRYDDIISTPKNSGQHLAHAELLKKHKLLFNQTADNIFQFMGYDV